MKRLFNAFGWFWAALTKRRVFQFHWFKLVEGMMKFLETTADNNYPMKCELQVPKYDITKLGEINWIKGEHTIVLHLWCGVDNVDSPFKRIDDLKEENEKLKRKINNMLNSEPNVQECDDKNEINDKARTQ